SRSFTSCKACHRALLLSLMRITSFPRSPPGGRIQPEHLRHRIQQAFQIGGVLPLSPVQIGRSRGTRPGKLRLLKGGAHLLLPTPLELGGSKGNDAEFQQTALRVSQRKESADLDRKSTRLNS